MEQTLLSIEKEQILAYIDKFGNTKIGDLINYGACKLKLPKEQIQNLLSEMILCGELERVVHGELEPPGDYVRWGTVPIAVGLQAQSISLSGKRLEETEVENARSILSKAEEIAEKRIKGKYAKTKQRK